MLLSNVGMKDKTNFERHGNLSLEAFEETQLREEQKEPPFHNRHVRKNRKAKRGEGRLIHLGAVD